MSGTLVAVLLLLASVGTASAECTWVLWGSEAVAVEIKADGGIRNQPSGRWAVISAMPTFSECDATATTQYRLSVKARATPVAVGDTFTLFRCFPDTVDPRGPKGK